MIVYIFLEGGTIEKNIKIISGAILLIVILIAAYFSFFSNNVKIYNESQKGAIIVSKGETFKISLKSNPTTGYQWNPEYDNNKLELVNSSYKPDEPQLAGSGGNQIFEFKVIGSNSNTSIKFGYTRPWESVPPIEQKSFDIIIK